MGDATIVIPGWLVAFMLAAMPVMAITIIGLIRERTTRERWASEQRSFMATKMQPIVSELDAIQRGLAEFVALTHPELVGKVSFTEGYHNRDVR